MYKLITAIIAALFITPIVVESFDLITRIAQSLPF